jgi:hypothetical protein
MQQTAGQNKIQVRVFCHPEFGRPSKGHEATNLDPNHVIKRMETYEANLRHL